KQLLSASCMLTVPLLLSGQNEDDNDIIELSPFTISESDSIGYQATSTLAGSRLNTPLRDVGAAIQVLTAELFEDTGSTNMEEILVYATNMESHGVMGNFAGGPGQNHNGRFEQDNQRLNPQSAQRVRGLAEASLTRDFFLTDIPFESYNTERIAVSRGANSLLFGIGSPGGIINNTTKRANVDGEDFGEFSMRYGERDSHRESFDYHKVLIDDRLALRLMGLYKDTQYQQRPAYELDRRVAGALDAVLFTNENSEWLGKTKLRFNFELGSVRGAPPHLTPPNDGYSMFFELPDIAALERVPGVYMPGYLGGSGKPGVALNELGLEAARYHPEFGYTTWQPKMTLDNRLGINNTNTPLVTDRSSHRARLKFNYDSPIPITYVNYGGNQFQTTNGDAFRATGTVDEMGNPVAQGPATHAIGVDGLPYPVIRDQWDYIETGSLFMGNRNDQFVPNFAALSILDPNVWDNENHMIQGLTQWRNQEFNTETFVIEQPLLNGDAGFEFVYDKQHFWQEANIPFSDEETIGDTHNNDVVIDINEYLITGEPNPNLGRPMMKTDNYPGQSVRESDRESVRATGFAKVDFEKMFGDDSWLKWLGKHTITGLYNRQTIDRLTMESASRLQGVGFNLGDPDYINTSAGIAHINYFVIHDVYLGPDARQFSNPGQLQLNTMEIESNYGDGYDHLHWNRNTQQLDAKKVYIEEVLLGGGRGRNEITTEVVSVQSRWLDDNLVGLIGLRSDSQKTWANINQAQGLALGIPPRLAGGNNAPINPEYFRLHDEYSEGSGDTVTWSLVGHMPDEWLGPNVGISAHYGESENFQIGPTRRTPYGDMIGAPSGTTEEYGVTFNFAQNKLIARLNWYETAATNANISGGTALGFFGWIGGFLGRWDTAAELHGRDMAGFQAAVQEGIDELGPTGGDLNNPSFQSFGDVYNEIISWLPSEVQGIRNLTINPATGEINSDPNPGESATQDFVSEGFEIDLTANLTDNWRVFVNVAQQESVLSNIALPFREISGEILNNIRSSPIGKWTDSPTLGEGQSFESRFVAIVGAPLGAIAARDGQLAREMREWRVNAVTSYSFTEGALAGFTIGGGLRWQDENAIGYPNLLNSDGKVIPDLANPFLGPDQLNGDLWAGYERPIWDGKVNWKIQLNVRNAFGDDAPIPVVINPDGNIAVVRNSQPREVFLTNTFSF
ncbi:MAG: hypothetical protein O3C43_24390, partial [Verrucomicrobia bacterium]|nr:hypothetical protein [Verrucomicrobiota bacterium]MDA1069627.1 hypothetical protein [Verrucomicrobiota bacterium]